MCTSTHLLLAARLEQEPPVSHGVTVSYCYKEKPKDQVQLTHFQFPSLLSACGPQQVTARPLTRSSMPHLPRYAVLSAEGVVHTQTWGQRTPLVYMDPLCAHSFNSEGAASSSGQKAVPHACSATLTSHS